MKHIDRCPLCGCENERIVYKEETGYVCEDYYNCKNCSYFEFMCYSKKITGVVKGEYPIIYKNEIKRLGIPIFTKKQREQL